MAIKFSGNDPQLRHLQRVLKKQQFEAILKARQKKQPLTLKGIRNDK